MAGRVSKCVCDCNVWDGSVEVEVEVVEVEVVEVEVARS